MKDRLIHYAEFFGFLLAAVALWFTLKPQPAPVGTTVLAKPARELQNKPKTELHPEKVQAYAPPVKKDLGLPVDVQDDPNKYVLGSAKLPADTRPHTVTAVIDAKTGAVQMFERRDVRPWLAAEKRGFIQIGPGYRNGMQIWRFAGAFDAVQAKGLHLGFDGSLDNDLQRYVGLHLKYEL